jgi:polysaccharide biosynthesis transport protein
MARSWSSVTPSTRLHADLELDSAPTRGGVVKLLLNKVPVEPAEYIEDMGGTQAPSIDFFATIAAVLRRWKLVTAIALSALIATYGVLKLVPSVYKSNVEILVYDPQQQIDATVQKPISPFVDALGFEAMNTEIKVLQSKSVALRVATELGLDMDPEFQTRDRIADLVEWSRNRIAGLVERLGLPGLGGGLNNTKETFGRTEEKAEKLDRSADAMLKEVEVSQEAYVITVSATARNPIKAQRLASTIASDYLASQREARQEALEHVSTWLKGRVDDLQSRVLETEASIEKLKIETGIRDTELDSVKEQQIRDINTSLTTIREEVGDKRARLEQARHIVYANGDLDSIPELTASGSLAELRPALTELRRKQMELNFGAAALQNKLGERSPQVVSIRTELAAVNKEIDAKAAQILENMKNVYDIAVRRQQSLEADLQTLTTNLHSEASVKLQQLRRAADADRKAYESYLSQYNDIAERRELQDASARIISPATLPRSPSSPNRAKFYGLGGMAGLGGGFLLAFLLEHFRPGLKTTSEVEESFGLPVVGIIPLVFRQKTGGVSYRRPLDRLVSEPFSQLSEAVRAMRISLELSSANPKIILVTSALPGEGKSTAAMLLAASSASSGKRTILLDCDFRLRSTSVALRNRHEPGLSELLRGTAKLTDAIAQDPATKAYVIPAGSMMPNAADLLMSQGMVDLVTALRGAFDYIVMDAPPLLPVVDALALATVADKILVIVEWCQTPRASISEAFRVLGPKANRVAGIVFNKVDFDQFSGYGAGYHYRSNAKYFGNA